MLSLHPVSNSQVFKQLGRVLGAFGLGQELAAAGLVDTADTTEEAGVVAGVVFSSALLSLAATGHQVVETAMVSVT